MSDCVFCQIIAGDSPVTLVHEGERCVAFMDIRPLTTGHVLVVARKHAESFPDVDSDTAAEMMRVAHRLDAAMRESGLRCEGVNMIMADGVAAGQEVLHVHMHVFPAYRNDGFALKFPPEFGRLPQREELEDAANLIRKALAGPAPEP
jgi:histidine triad (HIT) family protein